MVSAAGNDDEIPEWLEGFFDDVAAYDDDEMAEAEDDATARSGKIQNELADATDQEIALLRKMEAWAARYKNVPDAKMSGPAASPTLFDIPEFYTPGDKAFKRIHTQL